MRIDEIASAEDQIALFKLITDKVWQALADEQQANAEAKARRSSKAKLKRPTVKNAMPPTLRPIPKSAARPAPPAKPTTQLNRTQPYAQQPQTNLGKMTKQINNVNRSNDLQSSGFGDSQSEYVNPPRGHDRHS
jgi:hypothetical protein